MSRAMRRTDYIVFTIDQNEDDDFYIAEVTLPEVCDPVSSAAWRTTATATTPI